QGKGREDLPRARGATRARDRGWRAHRRPRIRRPRRSREALRGVRSGLALVKRRPATSARLSTPQRATIRLDRGEPLDRIREAFYETDEQRRLCIGFRPPLLPVLQSAYVRAQIGGKQSPRDFEALANAHQLQGCDLGSRLEVDRMRAKGASPLPGLRKRRHAFRQFGKQIALVRTSPLRPCPWHVALLASSSALCISFNAWMISPA